MKHGMSETQARETYGKSKMTVVNETTGAEKYQKLQFVEFLDLLCRLTKWRYRQASEPPFADQLKCCLDLVFRQIGARRSEAELAEWRLTEGQQTD